VPNLKDLIDPDQVTKLKDLEITNVDLVGQAANGRRFALMKSESDAGMFTPADVKAMADRARAAKADHDTADRKHDAKTGAAMSDGSYPIENKADLDNAIHAVGRGNADHDAIRRHIITRAKSLGASSEIPDNWNSDGSLKKEALVADQEQPVAKDELDPTDVDLTEATVGDDPTDPELNEPGSPDWERVDAESAGKWIQVLGWAKHALDELAGREDVESVTADPDDAENAWNLQDAGCAIDYAIGILAQYKVSEIAEAEIGDELAKQVSDIAKAFAGFNPDVLPIVDGFTAVRKAGRVLSKANEQALNNAIAEIQKVLASLPAAPDDAAKATQSGDPEPDNASEAVDADPDIPEEGDVSTTQKAASDLSGLSISDLTRQALTGSQSERNAALMELGLRSLSGNATPSTDDADTASDDTSDATDDSTDDTSDATDTPDASADSTDDAATIPGTDTVQSPAPDTTSDEDVTKGFAAQIQKLEEVLTPLAEKVGVAADLADVVKGLQERVERIAKMPDDRNSPKLFGATGPGPVTRDGSADELAPLRKAVEDAPTAEARKNAQQALLHATVKARFTA